MGERAREPGARKISVLAEVSHAHGTQAAVCRKACLHPAVLDGLAPALGPELGSMRLLRTLARRCGEEAPC